MFVPNGQNASANYQYFGARAHFRVDLQRGFAYG